MGPLPLTARPPISEGPGEALRLVPPLRCVWGFSVSGRVIARRREKIAAKTAAGRIASRIDLTSAFGTKQS